MRINKEVEIDPIDEAMDIEQIFDPEDCTMVMEDYGMCHDYPCKECVDRLKESKCKNCFGEDKDKDNSWGMCRSCANQVHKDLKEVK